MGTIMKKFIFYVLLCGLIFGCGSSSENSIPKGKFDASVLSAHLTGGYIDSIFMTKDASRVYFIHSIYPPKVLNGATPPASCGSASQLPGHITATGLEWNTDIYYVEWNGSNWSAPINVGSPVNTLGMECCMWLNSDETEMIFYRATDLDGDGIDGDVGLPQTGNYITTRASRSDPWGTPVALTGDYGTTNQSNTVYRHDIHKVPSNNYYLWETDASGNKRLLFGNWNGAGYDTPALMPGTIDEDTQPWVSDDETTLIYNHRDASGTSDLYSMTRANTGAVWGAPTQIPTADFDDQNVSRIWGEPSFDTSQTFMMFIRFNTTDTNCWSAEIMYSPGNFISGFATPVKLN